ncbi:hypothetical protein JKP88DRAFT_166292 [Tribonema minus]|uniref:ATP-dependent Zn protease n=1 Tax=Tribonema minus TaxID=303371 RepID=A0A835Z0R4_9STRA|nr:hypothetical protein JKP88DRAFT_166292 [Tribonema minus]
MMAATGIRGDIIDKLGLNGRRDIDRIAFILFGLVVGSFLSSTSLIEFLPGPDIVRFTASWVIAFIPYGFLTLGIAKPALLQKSLVKAFSVNPEYRERLARHEAGHFLVGYLCGMPIESYQADSVTNAVAFFPAFYSSDAMLRRIPEPELLRLAAVSLGGIVAECLRFGTSEGGYADLMQLNALLRCGEERLSDREQQDRVRFAAVMAHSYLKTHGDALDRLTAAVQRSASVTDCIRAIEDRA